MNEKRAVLYACSGASSAGQMANWIALELDKAGIGEMSCIAGVGGGVKPILEKARAADRVLGVDGCPLHCVRHTLEREGLKCTLHYDLSKYGVIKKYQKDFDMAEADLVRRQIMRGLKEK